MRTRPALAALSALPLAAVVASSLAGVPQASAADTPGVVTVSGTSFVYRAAMSTSADYYSSVRIYRTADGGYEYVVDPEGVTAAGACEPASQVFICTTTPGAPTIDLVGNTRGTDTVNLYVRPVPPDPYFSVPATVRTGAGKDSISLSGIAGKVSAGKGSDLIDVEASIDPVGPVATPGGDVHGGRGNDTISYLDATGITLRVSLDDEADDGRPGENDNIHSDVENITGPRTGFTAFGSPGANVLTGGKEGDDRLIGRGGRDELIGKNGNDRLDARDGRGGDVVSCGGGNDRVLLDRGDTMVNLGACERVTYGT